MNRHAYRTAGARRGFTLIETAVVLTITMIGALLVVPQWRAPVSEAVSDADGDARADARPGGAIVTLLREARRQAIAERQTVTLRVDVPNLTVRADTAGTVGSGVWYVRTDLLSAGEELVADRDVATLTFLPSGAAIADVLRIRHAGGWAAIVVEPWSGGVLDVAR